MVEPFNAVEARKLTDSVEPPTVNDEHLAYAYNQIRRSAELGLDTIAVFRLLPEKDRAEHMVSLLAILKNSGYRVVSFYELRENDDCESELCCDEHLEW